jgi:hypothetical protein
MTEPETKEGEGEVTTPQGDTQTTVAPAEEAQTEAQPAAEAETKA